MKPKNVKQLLGATVPVDVGFEADIDFDHGKAIIYAFVRLGDGWYELPRSVPGRIHVAEVKILPMETQKEFHDDCMTLLEVLTKEFVFKDGIEELHGVSLTEMDTDLIRRRKNLAASIESENAAQKKVAAHRAKAEQVAIIRAAESAKKDTTADGIPSGDEDSGEDTDD